MLFAQVIDPVALSLGPIKIHWYGIILGTAALVGLWLAVREHYREVLLRHSLAVCGCRRWLNFWG